MLVLRSSLGHSVVVSSIKGEYIYIPFYFNSCMVSERALLVINISLGLLSLLLLFTLLGVKLPTLGQAQYVLDTEEPVCLINWKDDFTPFEDLDRCCLQARQQLDCHREQKDNLDWVCQTGVSVKYWLNNKAYNYCRQQPYW